MTLPLEWDGIVPNEDDQLVAMGMKLLLEQAYTAAGVDSPQDALLARIATELSIIRTILAERLPRDVPWTP